MAPRVLVSDELSETAVQIFRDRGVEVDYMPKLGKDKEKLAEIIGSSVWAANYLTRHPILLDEVLDPRLYEIATDWNGLPSNSVR